MKNILIATDFSSEAYCALFYASSLFKGGISKFYIANFFGEKIEASVYSIVNEAELRKKSLLKKDSELACKETLHRIVRDSDLNSDRFEIIPSEQKLLPGILNLIQNKDIDLLVMGTANHAGTLKSIVETNTTKIIEHALNIPVLIIPRELDFNPLYHIAFASELIYEFNPESIKTIKAIAEKSGARITVIHDGKETEMSQRQWKNYNSFKSNFEGLEVSLAFSSNHIEVSKSIAEFVKHNKVDMLCMEYYKHSFVSNLFIEPVVEKIDRHLSFPFLILPAKSKGSKNHEIK
ncbi:universal stress protein [Christiangramia echinicola]|uniref:universal stress protein n=1 Tax=Christiangramia echinicola TaxID=279359 RepID=UPI0004140930|nr:universal stress protein [Christiangramia echinicola]